MRVKKGITKLLLLMMSIIMVMASAVTVHADEVNEKVKEARKGVLQVWLTYKDEPGSLGGGSSFLINEDTILTNYHVIHIEEQEENYADALQAYPDFNKDDVKIKVVVMNDVILEAKVINESKIADFAILELEQPIYDRTPLALNSDEHLSETQQVFALGFPGAVSVFQNVNSYTYSDVTVSDGRVTKTNESNGIKYVQHSADITAGDSGGPLVADDGSVVALDRGYLKGADGYNYSVAISQIRDVLDALGISYTDAGDSQVSATVAATEPASATGNDETTEEKEDETTKRVPVVSDDKDVSSDNKEEESGLSPVILAAIIGVIVVVIIVIIILIVTLGKGKKQAPSAVPGAVPPMPGAGGMQPVSGPVPPAPSAPYRDDGAGATTVLNEGAGETTVLGGGAQMQARIVIRIKTGERIQINRPEYIIGKERRRVDYCISDNNSVSRVHVKLVNRGGQLFLIDMNATNGTFINGTKLSANQEVRLSAGDRFKLADEEFQLQA